MAKNRRDFGSDHTNAESTSYNTVFVDTSLDTHLVLVISSSDTVYDFKEKMLCQHSEIFTRMDGVKIHSVQVKRLGHFYHMPDSMLMSSAFGGSKKAWYVFVEASCSGDDDCRYNNGTNEFSRLDELPSMLKKRKIECIENVVLTMNKKNKVENKIDPSVDASGKVQSDIETRKIVGELCDTLSSDANLMLASGAQKITESETILEQIGELEREEVYRDKSNSTTGEQVTDLEKVPPPQKVNEDKLVAGLVSKKAKKQKKILSVSHEQLAISQSNAMFVGSVSPANLNTGAPEANKPEAHMELVPNDDPKPTLSKRRNPLIEVGADGTNEESIPSLNFVGTSSPTEAVGSVGTKKKKTKIKKKAPGSTEVGTKITGSLSSTVADLALKGLQNDKIMNDQSMLSLYESQKNDSSDKEMVLSRNHDPQAEPSEIVKPSDQTEAQEMSEGGADGTNKSVHSLNFMGISSPTEAVGSVGTKKKKTKTKKKTPGSAEVEIIITAPLSSTVADLALKDPMNDKIVNDKSMLSLDESQKNDTSEKEIVLSHNHDPQVEPSESVRPSDQIEAQEMSEGRADGTDNKSVPSLNFMWTSSLAEAVGSVGTKKKKTKTKKKAPDSTEVGTIITATLSSTVADLPLKDLRNDKIVDDQSMLSLDESQKNDTSKNKIVLSSNHDPQSQPSESVKPLGRIEAHEMSKGSILSCNLSLPNEVVETGGSGAIKRKKLKAKKSAAKLQDKSDIDNLQETYLPEQGVTLDVEMNDGTAERNKTISEIDKLKDNSEFSSRYEPEGNKILDSAKETLNEKVSSFAETPLDHGIEAGKSGRSKKRRAKLHTAIDEDSSTMEHSIAVNASPAMHFEGDRGLSLNNESEVTSSKASKTSDLGEVTVNCSESGFTGQKLDNENSMEVVKYGGSQKKKRTKKHTDSVCDAAVTHFAREAQENQNTFSGTVEKEKSKMGARDSPLPDPDQSQETAIDLPDNIREAKNDENMDTSALRDQPIPLQANQVQELLPGEADKEQVIGENIKKKVKKPRRNLKNVAETHSNSKIKDLVTSGDKMGVWDPQCESMDRSASAETTTGNKSTLADVLLGKHAGVGSESSNPEEDLNGQVPSHHSRDNNMEGRPPETKMNTKNIAEISKAGDGVNFRQYFVSEQQQIEDYSASKVKESFRSTKAKRETKKPNFISDEAVKASQVRHNIDANQLEESSGAKGNKVLPLTNKEKSEAYGDVVKASKSHDVDEKKTPQKSNPLAVANGYGSNRNNHFSLKKNSRDVSTSSSSRSAKGSKRTFEDTKNKNQQLGFNKGGISAQKVLNKNDEDIVNSSQQKKSLLSASGAIFSDDSSESFGNETHGNSDASTRPPSDHSSSSGFSDGESELSQDSRRTELGNAKQDDGGRKSSVNSKHPDPREMSIDMILKSSKRFKKAKFTASQSQEADTESQTIEFVPENQANQ